MPSARARRPRAKSDNGRASERLHTGRAVGTSSHYNAQINEAVQIIFPRFGLLGSTRPRKLRAEKGDQNRRLESSLAIFAIGKYGSSWGDSVPKSSERGIAKGEILNMRLFYLSLCFSFFAYFLLKQKKVGAGAERTAPL